MAWSPFAGSEIRLSEPRGSDGSGKAAMDAIRTERLSKSFGDLAALRELSLRVAEGDLFGLVGPDGAGKTTTMRLLSAILEPTSGDAWVAGCHIVKEAEPLKEHIGYMSQRFGLYPEIGRA